ncbi:uncharacterized protein LOC132751612 [Ruditapes philippinarum]|uniref:uncharacterized protein LOC132751612 n=1 Tax=Ruditapes philippinarum TaxID=129788 RepID=UPI00295C28F5|nr:uncharacterized protein LOC132751612 [Ruditapes philippinarum]
MAYHCNIIADGDSSEQFEILSFVHFLERQINGWGYKCYIPDRDFLSRMSFFEQHMKMHSENKVTFVAITSTNISENFKYMIQMLFNYQPYSSHSDIKRPTLVPVYLNIDHSNHPVLDVIKGVRIYGSRIDEWQDSFLNSRAFLQLRDVLKMYHPLGPATFRMVSNNGPPLPMPMQSPTDHMVQQIVDENGILTHVILSPQPPGMMGSPMTGGPNNAPQYYPPYGGHYYSHAQYPSPHHHSGAPAPGARGAQPHMHHQHGTPPPQPYNNHGPVHPLAGQGGNFGTGSPVAVAKIFPPLSSTLRKQLAKIFGTWPKGSPAISDNIKFLCLSVTKLYKCLSNDVNSGIHTF